MWDDQAKWIWPRSHHIFSFLLVGVILHSKSYLLQKTPLKLDMSFQSYDLLKGFQNNGKQKDLNQYICKFRLNLLDHTTDYYATSNKSTCFPKCSFKVIRDVNKTICLSMMSKFLTKIGFDLYQQINTQTTTTKTWIES